MKQSIADKYLKQRITRRQAIKAGGVAAVGLIFTKPIIETIRPKSAFASYGPGPCVLTFDIFGVTENAAGNTELSIQVCSTGDCKDVSFVAIGLQKAGLTVISPSDGDTYTGSLGTYDVEYTNLNGNPGFPSVKFDSGGDFFGSGNCETFNITVDGTGHSGISIDCIAVKLGGDVIFGSLSIS